MRERSFDYSTSSDRWETLPPFPYRLPRVTPFTVVGRRLLAVGLENWRIEEQEIPYEGTGRQSLFLESRAPALTSNHSRLIQHVLAYDISVFLYRRSENPGQEFGVVHLPDDRYVVLSPSPISTSAIVESYTPGQHAPFPLTHMHIMIGLPPMREYDSVPTSYNPNAPSEVERQRLGPFYKEQFNDLISYYNIHLLGGSGGKKAA